MGALIHNKKKELVIKAVNIIIEVLYFPFKVFSRKPDLLKLSPKKILLIRLDHIGDVVMTSPAFRLVSDRFPEAELILLTDQVGKHLYAKDPGLNKVIAFGWPWVHQKSNNRFTKSKLIELYRLISTLRKENIDTVIDFRGDLRFVILFGVLIGAKVRVSNSRCGKSSLLNAASTYDVSKHEVERAIDVVSCFGTMDKDPNPVVFLELGEADLIKGKVAQITAAPFPGRFAVIAPYSSKDVKSWPMENFRSVISHLSNKGYSIFIAGTPDDAENARAMIQGLEGSVFSLAGRTSIRELAALLSISQLVLGVDTGVLHIASCFNVPIIAIFGSTRSIEFRPYSKTTLVLETQSCRCNQFLHDKCDFPVNGYAKCLTEVNPQMVINAIDNL